MDRTVKRLFGVAAAMGLALCVEIRAGENMIGRQSQNEGIQILPAPASGVKIDGDLSDWDFSGRIWCFADESIRNRFSVQVAAMWDSDNLYVAAKWKDSTPMFSMVDPQFNPTDGWKSDSMQIRLRTSDEISHLTTWYYTPRQEPCLHVAYGKDMTHPFGGPGEFWLGKAGGTDLGRGIELAYKKDADGQGFVQEMKIPWTIVCKQRPSWKAGDRLQMGFEFMWGDVTGKTWPIHRYADNMQPGKTSREFYFYSYPNWGEGTLLDHRTVPVRQYVGDSAKIQGTFPIRVTIPREAARFTVVIEDAEGKRIRNLAADCDPEVYAAANAAANPGERTVVVDWDCKDDHGQLVPAGKYHVRGLTQQGLSAEYDSYFYNPGTPPWQTKDSSGGWGADHSGPNNVVAAGDWTLITCPVVEGGTGLMGLDPSGRKKWGGEKRGISQIAADEKYAYAHVTYGVVKDVLCRFDVHSGAYKPFVRNSQPRPFDLPISDLFGGNAPGQVTAMAAGRNAVAIGFSGGKVVLLDKSSADILKQFDVPSPTGLAFDRNDKLYAWTAGKLAAIDLDTGEMAPIATPGVAEAAAIACDSAGNVVIADIGPDSQVKAFSPAGKLVYTCGTKGGRPIRGAFDDQAMMRMSSVAVDAKDQVWVTENWNYPRRVSVWGRDGKLIRDYIGNTGYAGTDCYLHDQDPSLAFCGPMEFHRDASVPGGWKLTNIMWVPDQPKGETFALRTDSNSLPERFTSSLAGAAHEYLYAHELGNGMEAHVVYLLGAAGWKPVAAVCTAGYMFGQTAHAGQVERQPDGPLAGLDAYDIVFWNNQNRDGAVQREECQVIPAAQAGTSTKRGKPAFELYNGWGGRIAPDLTIYTNGIARLRPDRIDSDGAPVYSPSGRTMLSIKDNGDLVPLADEHKLLCLSFKGYAGETTGLLGLDDQDGRILWSYPNRYPGVHGSHNAPMPEPGLLIGPLKICGVAKVNDQVGNVMLLRGNLGQDFILTSDGLYVGSLFQDGRLPADPLPATVGQLQGMPLNQFSEGGEPFNGWFGKETDGVIRLTTGMAREAGMVLRISGLDTIRRFDGGEVMIDATALATASKASQGLAAQPGQGHAYQVSRLSSPMKVDADGAKWAKIPAIEIRKPGLPEHATARLAYDASSLYLMFEVADASPWLNEGKDFTRLFKTGDAVDLQLGTNSKAGANPGLGDLRVVIANFGGKPTAVLMRPIDPKAPSTARVRYTSPVGTKQFDRVQVLTDAVVAVKAGDGRYTVEAAIPFTDLGLKPAPEMKIRGDLGFISSDGAGMVNVARTYWSNSQTNLVNDLPLEAWFGPDRWGEFQFK